MGIRTLQSYDKYQYLFPPRPEVKIPVGLTNFYDKKGWAYQAKLNGTCTVIFTNGTEFVVKTRHENEDHRAWSPMPEHVEFFKSLASSGKWSVFVAELMHNKSPLLKNMLYVFDVLVRDGVFLHGSTWQERQDMLATLIPGDECELWHKNSDYVVRARNFVGNARECYERITETPYVEGVVMKDPKARLDLCNKKVNNTGWQVKCRKATKNYGF